MQREHLQFVSVYDDVLARLFKFKASTTKNTFPASAEDKIKIGYTKRKTSKTKADREHTDNITNKNMDILTRITAIQAVPYCLGQTTRPHMNLGTSINGDN